MRRTLIGGLGAAAMLLVASCSASTTNYKDAATKIIEGQLQDELAMRPPAMVLPCAAAITGLGRLRHRQHIWK